WDKKGFFMPEMRGMMVPEVAMGASVAAAMIAKEAGYNMPAPLAVLSSVFEGMQLPMDKALSVESKYFATLLTDPVARNIIRTTFISKLAAEKGARRPEGVPKTTYTKVGVLGAGMMGAGIALVAAKAGIEVILIDRDVPSAEKGKGYSEKVWGKEVSRGSLSQEKMDEMLSRITPTDDFALLEGCQLVVEAVFEDVAIKAETTQKAEAVILPDAVFASNTSTLPITGLAEGVTRQEDFIGLHFFSPVDKMKLLEIVRGENTSDAALARAFDFALQIGKTPIVVNDARGFFTSRVIGRFIAEAVAAVGEGVEPASIEQAALQAGYPTGALQLLDELTLTLSQKIQKENRRAAEAE
ncbi:MAG: 3-hydroxyacyl-CoA dehydrogenase family protein, partial [Actinobacteria bacterium]|nr:3-hydroxyacyl-CoA dehydrogenase family protein [Actinomycetota bacterium]